MKTIEKPTSFTSKIRIKNLEITRKLAAELGAHGEKASVGGSVRQSHDLLNVGKYRVNLG